jgi:hypothetical protein
MILLDATGEFWKLNGTSVSHATLGEGPCLPEDADEIAFPHSDLNESDLFALFRPATRAKGNVIGSKRRNTEEARHGARADRKSFYKKGEVR